MKNILFLVLITFFIVGCSNKQEYFNSNHDLKSQGKVSYTIIADDMFNFVSRYFRPNQTTFYIDTNALDKSFYNYLVNKFRTKGYAITDKSNIENLTFLSYKIQEDNNIILVTYFIDESKISRAYIIKDNKISPAGEITAFNFELK